MSKPILLISIALTLFLSLFVTNQVQATHCAGGELIYEWKSDSTYRFFFKFYRDCTGANEQQMVGLCVRNTCNPLWNATPTMNKWTGSLPGSRTNGSQVDIGCAQYP